MTEISESINGGTSLKKRYLYKLVANLVGFAINVVTQAIIPRGLGPKAYGDFYFLSSFFSRVISFLDMGTSIGFYTKLSRRANESYLVTFYVYFVVLLSFISVGFVTLAHWGGFSGRIWPEQGIVFIYFGAGWGILSWMSQILTKMTDAYGVTVPAEKGRIVQKALGLVILVVLFLTGQLGLSQFFYFQYFILVFLGGVFIWVMRTNGHLLQQSWRLSQDRIKDYIREFYDYSHPLFVFSLVGLIVGIFDRWFLQFYGGSVEQGLYSLSFQIGAICFLFSSAMSPLLMREFSIAYGNNDLSQMASLFRRYIPLLYAITAYFACFIAIQADKVVSIIGGSRFQEAGLAVTIMAFYPIHQTYGQMTASVFYATGQTKLYRNIGIIFMLVGLPITYFLLAPSEKMGLNAGANGLAIKMVFINIIGVNVQLYYNSKLLGLKFWRYLGHQIVNVFALLIVAATAAFSIDCIIGTNNHIFVSFFLSGLFYTLIVLIMIYLSPILFGLKKSDIRYVIQLCADKLRE